MTLRLGRISYANMAPVFYDLEGLDAEQVPGVPTELNARLLAGEIDVAPISSIEYARNADTLRLLPRLCVSTEGAVDSIQLITRKPLEQVRSVAVTPESATSVVLTQGAPGRRRAGAARPAGGRAHADRRRGAAKRLRGPDAAPRPGPALGRAHRASHGVSRSGPAAASVRDGLEALERAHLRSLALARGEPEALARAASEQYGWPAGFLARYFEKLRYHFGPRERAGLIRFFELAHLAGELDHVPDLQFVELESVTP